jgi:hypothetical protein
VVAIGDAYQTAWAESGLNYANQVAGSVTMPVNGWVTGAHCIMGGYRTNPWTRLVLWASNGTPLWIGPGFSAGVGLSQHDGSVWNQRVSGGSGLNVGFWRDPGADAQWGIDTGQSTNWAACTVGGAPTNFSWDIPGSSWQNGALSSWIDYVPNASPNTGAWQSPTPSGTISDTNPQFSGTLPQNPADSAYESVGNIAWSFTRTDTGQQVAWVQWPVNANISSWTNRPSDFGISLQPGVPYSTNYAYSDSWGVWSGWSTPRTFTINAGPNAPAPTAPSGKQSALTGLNFTATYSHGSSLGSSNVQVQVLDSTGKTVLFDSGTVAKSVANNTAYTVAQWFTGLQWGTTYQWWTRAQDTSSVWGPWSAKPTFTTDGVPTTPVAQSPADGAIIAGGASLSLSAVVATPDGSSLTSVVWDLYDETVGAEVAGYPATVTGTFPSGSVQSRDVTSALTAGHAYHWAVQASDSTLTSPWSPSRAFTYTVPPSVSVTTPAASQVETDATAAITISYGGSGAKAADQTVVTDTTTGRVVYDSGTVLGNRTAWSLPYGTLQTGHAYRVQVTVTDVNGITATSSPVAFSASWAATQTPRLKLLINGVDRTLNMDQENWYISQDWGRQGDTGTIYLTDEYASTPNFAVPANATVELRDLNLGQILFGGLVPKPRRIVESPNLCTWMLSCTASGTAYLNARTLTFDYTNWTADAIARDLLKQAACGVTSNHVQAGPVIARFQGQNMSVTQALQKLCQLASTTSTFGWWVDGGLDLHFGSDLQTMAEPSGVTFTDQVSGPATTITGHYTTDSQTYYEWDATTLKTRVLVQGSSITRRFTEQFLGDGTTRAWRLSYPYQTNPEYAAVVVNGTQYPSSSQSGATTPWILTQGAPGVWSLSVQPGAAPPASGAVIEITYNYVLPVIAVVQSPEGIAASPGPNGGYWDSVVVDETLTDLASAQARGQRETAEYGLPQERATFRTSEAWAGWVSVGQSVVFQSATTPDQLRGYAAGIDDAFLIIQLRANGTAGGYRYLTITAVRI